MRSSMLCVWGACVCFLVGCGSSGATDFFDGPNSARVTSAASGAASIAGSGNTNAHAGASAGGSSSGPGPGAGGNPNTMMGGSDAPCSPAKDVTGGTTGPFNSLGAECLHVTGVIAGWGCSNFDGRSVKVNGKEVMCGQVPLPDPMDGGYYFDVSAGMYDYASFYWY